MKKALSLLLALVLCLSLCACGVLSQSEKNTTPEKDTTITNTHYYKLGETVSTDIFEFTLNAAEFCIALNNVNNDERYSPKEYDPQKDSDNPYVAPVGHTFAAFSYTVSNLNRASSEFHNGSFATVKYDGKNYISLEEGAYFSYADKYIMDANGKLSTQKGGKWYNNPGRNLLLMVGEKETRRARIDIAADIKDLTADVEITFSIPNSDGSKTEFTYLVTEADRSTNTAEEIEMSLELALSSFTKDEGQEYFSSHMAEYPIVSGNEIANHLNGKWTVDYIIADQGHWSGHFWFEDNGAIKDDYGYVNNRSWKIEGDTVIIDGEIQCEMRQVADYVYLLIHNGSPYLLMQK